MTPHYRNERTSFKFGPNSVHSKFGSRWYSWAVEQGGSNGARCHPTFSSRERSALFLQWKCPFLWNESALLSSTNSVHWSKKCPLHICPSQLRFHSGNFMWIEANSREKQLSVEKIRYHWSKNFGKRGREREGKKKHSVLKERRSIVSIVPTFQVITPMGINILCSDKFILIICWLTRQRKKTKRHTARKAAFNETFT